MGKGDKPIREHWLYYQDKSSDKVYYVCINQVDKNQYVVDYKFGRRNAALRTGTKTMIPVGLYKAEDIYKKILGEKLGEGYCTGTAYNPRSDRLEKIKNFTGLVPQVLNSIEEYELPRYLSWDAFWAQEKKDGKRITLKLDNGKAIGCNKKGIICDVPDQILQTLVDTKHKTLGIDGELIGNTFHAFDTVEKDGIDRRDQPYCTRYSELSAISFKENILVIEVAKTTEEKKRMLIRLRNEGREGIVFKQWMAKYTPGRPLKGGTQFKFKFWDSASVLVSGHTPNRRSVQIAVVTDPYGLKHVQVGSVSIPPNKQVPPIGAIIEVQYLYAFKGGSLYQPIYLGVRDDMDIKDAKIEQLKWKLGEVDEEVVIL